MTIIDIIGLIIIGTLIVYVIFAAPHGYFNFSFLLYLAAYEAFNKPDRSYYNFVHDFKVEKKNEGTNSQEVVVRESLFRLLEEQPNLAKEYFSKEQFRFKVEYSELIKKSNLYDPKAQKKKPTLNFRDILILPQDRQIELIDKIKTHLSSDTIKGKSCAHLIQALRNNHYIQMENNKRLIEEMSNYFSYDFGSYAGVNDYLSENSGKIMNKSQIETLQAKFKINVDNEKLN